MCGEWREPVGEVDVVGFRFKACEFCAAAGQGLLRLITVLFR